MKRLAILLVSLLLIISLATGCAGKSAAPDRNTGTAPEGVPTEDYAPMPNDDGGFIPPVDDMEKPEDVLGGDMGAKIIKSGYMSVETLDFDDATSGVVRRVQQAGGFIASSNVQGVSKDKVQYRADRKANFKLRIPSTKFEQFMTDVGELGSVTRSETWGDDVSAKYYDTEARVETLKVQEDRLLAILAKAEKLTDIIELERELSRVRYEIENHTGTLKKWDNLVAYSTLELDVLEVQEIKEVEVKPVTLWEKISQGFKDSIKSVINILEFMLVFIVASLPFLVLFSIIGIIVFVIVRAFTKKKKD